jgi:small nuclear ribonucleoprotein (snRNP)-like protein
MKSFLSGFVGKKIDVVCTGGVAVRGQIESIEADVLVLKDEEEKVCYVAIDKITVVWETKDKSSRTGFIGGFANRQ